MLSEEGHYISVALYEIIVIEEWGLGFPVIIIVLHTLQSHCSLLSVDFHLTIVKNSADGLVAVFDILFVIYDIWNIECKTLLFFVETTVSEVESIEVKVVFVIILIFASWWDIASS